LKRDLAALTNKTFDVIVIGAGIFGSCTAWDAALRGMSVALVEKKDFSHATSANHLKMVHGGIRYLQHGDIYRVRESSRERSALLRIAPHLTKPLPIVMPTYGHGKKGKEILKVGMLVYDALTCDRNKGLSRENRIPGGRLIGREEIRQLFPDLDATGLTGGAVFCDGQIGNTPRLSLSFLRSAVEAGAEVANYLGAEKFLWEEGKVTGIIAKDEENGDKVEIRGNVVINAAGPWAAHLMDDLPDLRKDVQPVFSRDLSFMVKRRFNHQYGLAVPTYVKDADAVFDRGGRHLFFAPWREYTLVGVWHKIVKSPSENITVEQEELKAFADEVNHCYPGMAIDPDDIVRVNTGLTLYGEEAKQGAVEMSFGKRSLLIDHEVQHKVGGLITLVGVRATTARGMAEKTIDMVARKIPGNHRSCSTETTPLFGGDMDRLKDVVDTAQKIRPSEMGQESMEALVGNHGTKYKEVLQIVLERPDLMQSFGGSTVIKAEVIYAIRKEMAMHLSDVVFRRTDLASGALPEKDVLQECGVLMGAELGWSDDRINREIAEVEHALPQFS